MVAPASSRTVAEATRDSYFTANPSNLAQFDAVGAETLGILLYFMDGSNVETAAQTRVAAQWRDSATIIALQGEAGADGMGAIDQSIPENTVLLAGRASPGDPLTPQASSLDDSDDAMISTNKMVSAVATLSGGQTILGAGDAFAGRTPTEQLFYALGFEWTEAGGTQRPAFLDAPAAAPAVIQSDNSQEISGASIQFRFDSTETGLAFSYELESMSDVEIADCNFTSEALSFGSGNFFFDYRAANGGVGFTMPARADTPGGNGRFTIELPFFTKFGAATFFREGVPTNVTLSSPSGEVLRFAGGPLTQPESGTQQVPFVTVTGSIGQLRGLLHQGDIDNTSTTDALITAAEVDRRIAAGGSGPAPSEPVITLFNIQGQQASVNPDTELSGTVLFNLAVMRPDQVDGTLSIAQDGTQIATGIAATATTHTATITTVTLAAGQSTTFVLSGASDSGQAFSRSFIVRAAQLHEFAYYGIRPTNDFMSVDTADLSSTDITSNDQFDVAGAFADTHVLGILVPSNMDLARITTLGVPVTSSFTRTLNVRIVSGQEYILYHLQNSGGVDGQAAYTVEIR